MSIDKRLEEARGHCWEASKTASWEVYWAAYGAAHGASSGEASLTAYQAAYWVSRYEDCSYEVQIEILKGLLDD